MAIDLEKTYQLSELAEELGLSVETVRRRVRSGKLKASRTGRTYFVSGVDAITSERQAHISKLDGIEQRYRAKVGDLVQDLIDAAVGLLQQDIRDPILTGEGARPDDFMLRANCIGLAFFQNHCWALAGRLYDVLRAETWRYREQTGNWRHSGALLANLGIAHWGQGNIDAAIICWLRAAEEDRKTYRVEPKASYALRGLFEQHVARHVREYALKAVRQVNRTLTPDDVKSLCETLRDSDLEFAFMAYLTIAYRHGTMPDAFPNVFSSLQILSALRNLSCLLEVQLKTIAGNMQPTLFPIMSTLYEKNVWWRAFDRKRQSIGATKRSSTPVDEQLADAIAITPADKNERFWQSLLVAYIVRNHATHQMEPECALVKEYFEGALAHILHVMITASRHI